MPRSNNKINTVPSNIIPSNKVPSNIVPSNIIPSNKISSNIIPTNTPSMMNTLKEGFSFGIGSAIAHNTINSLFSSKPVPNNCEFLKKEINNNTSPELIEKLKNDYIKCLEK
jgi:hypothetical protein